MNLAKSSPPNKAVRLVLQFTQQVCAIGLALPQRRLSVLRIDNCESYPRRVW
jgi:hypothetical protein